jgi:hypothetical protein
MATDPAVEVFRRTFRELKATTDRERETGDPRHAGGTPVRIVTEQDAGRKAEDVIPPK